MINKILFSSQKTNWRTPQDLYNQLNQEFHFDFDPCPSDPDVNGIFCEWGQINFVNPPYNRAIVGWLEKAILELKKGKTSVFLLPVRTDTKWFHKYVLPHASEIRFLDKRLTFSSYKNRAPFPSMIVVFKKESD